MGSDYFTAEQKHFDYIEGCDRLALFDYVCVPKITRESVPEHVSEVRFTADLTHLQDVRVVGYDRDNSDLFNAIY